MIGMHGNRFLLSPDGTKLRDCCCGRDWVVYVGCLVEQVADGFDASAFSFRNCVRNDGDPGFFSDAGVCAIFGVCPAASLGSIVYNTERRGTFAGRDCFSVRAFGYYPTLAAANRVFSEYSGGLYYAAVCGCDFPAIPADSYSFSETVLSSPSPDWTRVGTILVPSITASSRACAVSFSGYSDLRIVNQFGSVRSGNQLTLATGEVYYVEQKCKREGSQVLVPCSVSLSISGVPVPDCVADKQALIAAIPRNGEELGAVGMLEELEAEL